jgi:hypothetical protein
MADENTEVEEVETEEVAAAEPSRDEQFSEFFDQLQAKPAETDEVETDADPAEEVAVEEESPAEPEPVKAEGPSAAMKRFAKDKGVLNSAIALAQNDEQLSALIDELEAASREVEAKPEPIKEPEFTLWLPEDEIEPDDPYRKKLDALHSHYESKFNKLNEYVGGLFDWALEREKEQEAAQKHQALAEADDFDSIVDSLKITALGDRSTGELAGLAPGLRNAIYWRVKELQQDHPRESRKQLIQRAVGEAGYQSPEQKRTNAIKDANGKRLGGGASKPLAPTPLSKDQQFDAFFDRLTSKNK